MNLLLFYMYEKSIVTEVLVIRKVLQVLIAFIGLWSKIRTMTLQGSRVAIS